MRLRSSKLRNTICDLRIASRDRVASGGRSPLASRPSPHSGVALVVTIVLLSVITFLAIVFLALTGRETGASKTSVNQTTARFATDTGVEHAKAALLAGILSSRSVANFGLLTSTNYYNYNGYDPAAVELLTNVNYEYRVGGGALSQAQFLQNVSNLYYGARAPVYVTNRAFPNSNEFRYYLDLNRNGRHDLSGLWPVRSETGFYDTNGLPIPFIIPGNTLSNYVKGDPEWRGILDRPNQPHGPENQFLSRYAYMVVPIGKTLDVNYGFNNAKPNNLPYYYLRNQGVGSWEINHAAFFADLNTNYWNSFAFTPYDYQTNQNAPSIGTAFEDAYTLWRWRVGIGQRSVQTLFGPAGVNAFQTDFADGYSAGPVLADPRGYSINDPDNAPINRTGSAWPGDDMQNHFFSSQDFFDTAKTAVGVPNGVPTFTDRLTWAGTSNSTYNAYTFYRMLDQLGMDSAPEDSDKLNLNYVNVGGLSATNFVRWDDTVAIQNAFGATTQPAKLFFTNVADRLLRAYTSEWLARDIPVQVGNTNISAYLDTFQTEKPFGVTDIPVMVSNKFVYNSALHRVLQVSANLWETKNGTNAFPTVFRPVFYLTNNNLYIRDFVVETRQSDIVANTSGRPIVDVMASTNLSTLVGSYADGNYLVFGVPLVIGAHKGLPNFNEFQIAPSFQLTRKVQLVKPTAASTVISQTNQFFTLSLTMPSAAEFWNPYMTNYTRPVTVYITNRTTLTLTNDLGVNYTTTFIVGDQWTSNSWPKFNSLSPLATQNKYSFVALMQTNIPFLPQVGTNIGYIPNLGFVSATNSSIFDTSQNLLMPRWHMTISNRVHAMILEQSTGQIIDYVLLGDLVCATNLTDVFSRPPDWPPGSEDAIAQAFKDVWVTNAFAANPVYLSGRRGVERQIAISRGDLGSGLNPFWKTYGEVSPGFSSVDAAIRFFQNFLNGFEATNTAVVPFSPTVKFSLPRIWQANDPLVHYQADDMFYADQAEAEPVKEISLTGVAKVTDNIGKVNDRYQPWGGNPVKGPDNALNSRSPAVKDPGVTSADMWEFPTNALPSIGWMGRVHRGTPWQSIYQKAADVNLASQVYSLADWGLDEQAGIRWRNVTGNGHHLWDLNGKTNYVQGYYSRPAMDRMLFDEFTTVLTDNAARGRLPINQTGLAAWSAVFSGVAVLVNTNPVAKQYGATIIQPAGVFDFTDTNSWPPLVKLWNGINRQRALTNAAGPIFPGAAFQTLGDILSVPELTDASPFLNTNTLANTISDAAYEWLPQQVLGLLQLGEPRFVIYSYGQSLQPAPDSIIAGGPFSGMCTNYAITAEVASRAVVKMVGSANPSRTNSFLPPEKRYPPRLVTESYNLLGPD